MAALAPAVLPSPLATGAPPLPAEPPVKTVSGASGSRAPAARPTSWMIAATVSTIPTPLPTCQPSLPFAGGDDSKVPSIDAAISAQSAIASIVAQTGSTG